MQLYLDRLQRSIKRMLHHSVGPHLQNDDSSKLKASVFYVTEGISRRGSSDVSVLKFISVSVFIKFFMPVISI